MNFNPEEKEQELEELGVPQTLYSETPETPVEETPEETPSPELPTEEPEVTPAAPAVSKDLPTTAQLLGFTPEDHEYYSKHPEKMEDAYVARRISELREEEPATDLVDLFERATAEYNDILNRPSDEEVGESARSVTATLVSSEPSDAPGAGYIHRAFNILLRVSPRVVAGGTSTLVELGSAGLRSLDWVVENASGGHLDLFDDDSSWVYKLKEGLPKEFLEDIYSFGGLVPEDPSAVGQFAEDLLTVFAGASVLKALATAVTTSAVLQKAATSTAATRIMSWSSVKKTRGAVEGLQKIVERNDKLKTAVQWAFEGQRFDLSSAVFTEPGSIVGLLSKAGPEGFQRWFHDNYDDLDPVAKRTVSYVEGLGMNLVFGSMGAAIKRLRSNPLAEKTLDNAQFIEQLGTLTKKVDDHFRSVVQQAENTIDPKVIVEVVQAPVDILVPFKNLKGPETPTYSVSNAPSISSVVPFETVPHDVPAEVVEVLKASKAPAKVKAKAPAKAQAKVTADPTTAPNVATAVEMPAATRGALTESTKRTAAVFKRFKAKIERKASTILSNGEAKKLRASLEETIKATEGLLSPKDVKNLDLAHRSALAKIDRMVKKEAVSKRDIAGLGRAIEEVQVVVDTVLTPATSTKSTQVVSKELPRAVEDTTKVRKALDKTMATAEVHLTKAQGLEEKINEMLVGIVRSEGELAKIAAEAAGEQTKDLMISQVKQAEQIAALGKAQEEFGSLLQPLKKTLDDLLQLGEVTKGVPEIGEEVASRIKTLEDVMMPMVKGYEGMMSQMGSFNQRLDTGERLVAYVVKRLEDTTEGMTKADSQQIVGILSDLGFGPEATKRLTDDVKRLAMKGDIGNLVDMIQVAHGYEVTREILQQNGGRIAPVIINHATAKNYISIGKNAQTLSGVAIVGASGAPATKPDTMMYLYLTIRESLENGKQFFLSPAMLNGKPVAKPRGLSVKAAEERARALHDSIVECLQQNTKGVLKRADVPEVLKGLRGKTLAINYTKGTVELRNGAVVQQSVVTSVTKQKPYEDFMRELGDEGYFTRLRELANKPKDKLEVKPKKLTAAQKADQEAAKLTAAKEAEKAAHLKKIQSLIRNPRRGWAQAVPTWGELEERYGGPLKAAAYLAYKTKLVGGLMAGLVSNSFGLDFTRDGRVDLKDLVAVAGAYYGVGYMTIGRGIAKTKALQKLEQQALADAIKAGHQDSLKVLMMAREIALDNAQNALDPQVVTRAQTMVKQLEEYIFSNKEGLLETSQHFERFFKAGADFLDVTFDSRALKKTINLGNIADLSKGSSRVVNNVFNFTSTEGIHKVFSEGVAAFREATSEPAALNQLLAGSETIRTMATRLLGEFNVSGRVASTEWLNKPIDELLSMVYTARTLANSIDNELHMFVKAIPKEGLGPRELHDFAALVFQRRALGEYLKAGGRNSPTLKNATAYVSRSVMLGVSPESVIKNLSNYGPMKETFETFAAFVSEGALRDPVKMSAMVNSIGSNVSMGKALLQIQYMHMFMHPRTWALSAPENAIGSFLGLITESGSALMRGQFMSEIAGRHGMLQGILNGVGGALQAAMDRSFFGSTKNILGSGREYSTARATSIMAKSFGLEEHGMLTRAFLKYRDILGVDPVDLVSSMDTFFRHVAYAGYENQKVVQAAVLSVQDSIKSGVPKTLAEAVADIRRNPSLLLELQKESLDAAKRLTYQDTLSGGFTEKVLRLFDHPYLKLLAPIVRTPLMSARFAVRHSPMTLVASTRDKATLEAAWAAYKSGKSWAPAVHRDFTELISRVVFGTTLALATYSAIEGSGWEITGTGEYDPEFDAKKARGARAFSLWNPETGDNISMERLSLFKMGLGALQDIFQFKHHRGVKDGEDNLEDIAQNALMTIGYSMYAMISHAQPDQIDTLKQVLTGRDSFDRTVFHMSDAAGSVLSRAIPSIFRVEGRYGDDYQRAYTGSLDSALQAIYSGLGHGDDYGRPKLDIYGQSLKTQGTTAPWMMSAGIPAGDDLMDGAIEAQYDLNKALGRRGNVGGKRLGSSDEEQSIAHLAEKYHGEYISQNREMFLRELESSKRFGKGKDHRKLMYNRLFAAASLSAKERLLRDPRYGPKVRQLLQGVQQQ